MDTSRTHAGNPGALATLEPTAFAEPERRIRVLLVDDQETVRQGLKMRLQIEPDFEVVGEASDGRITALVADLSPDVVLMDVAMPVVDGIAGTAALGEARLPVAVVMLSLYDDAQTRARASAAGAAGFVGKHQPEGDLVTETRRVAWEARHRLDAPSP